MWASANMCAFLTLAGGWMPYRDVSDDAKLLDRGAHRPPDGRTFAVPVERSCSTRRIDHVPQRCARYLDVLVENDAGGHDLEHPAVSFGLREWIRRSQRPSPPTPSTRPGTSAPTNDVAPALEDSSYRSHHRLHGCGANPC